MINPYNFYCYTKKKSVTVCLSTNKSSGDTSICYANRKPLTEVNPEENKKLFYDLKRTYYSDFPVGSYAASKPLLQKAVGKAINARTRWAKETLTGPLGVEKTEGPVYNFPSEPVVNVEDTLKLKR